MQQEIVETTNAVMSLSSELGAEIIKYLIPSRLNWDAIESIFGTLRQHAGLSCNHESVFRVLKMICCIEYVSPKANNVILRYDQI